MIKKLIAAVNTIKKLMLDSPNLHAIACSLSCWFTAATVFFIVDASARQRHGRDQGQSHCLYCGTGFWRCYQVSSWIDERVHIVMLSGRAGIRSWLTGAAPNSEDKLLFSPVHTCWTRKPSYEVALTTLVAVSPVTMNAWPWPLNWT